MKDLANAVHALRTVWETNGHSPHRDQESSWAAFVSVSLSSGEAQLGSCRSRLRAVPDFVVGLDQEPAVRCLSMQQEHLRGLGKRVLVLVYSEVAAGRVAAERPPQVGEKTLAFV